MILSYGHEPTRPAVMAMGEHLEMTIHISKADAAAIGYQSGELVDWFLSALRALAALRTGEVERVTEREGIERGPADVNTWYWAINDLDYRLIPRLEGIRDAAVRAHAAAEGSLANLAAAMDVPRSTAQSRREKLLTTAPTGWESWARQGGPTDQPKQWPARVTFESTGDNGPADQVTVPNCPAELHAELVAAATGTINGESVFHIECEPAGAAAGLHTFRAAHIRNVQVHR